MLDEPTFILNYNYRLYIANVWIEAHDINVFGKI